MSRIGKKPVLVPSGVEVSLNGNAVAVKGPKGELSAVLSDLVAVEKSDDSVLVSPINKSQDARRFWGLSRSVVSNLVVGVSDGFTKKLELVGVGYRAQVQGQKLKLNLGFSHDVDYDIPEGVNVECATQTELVVSGIDKQKVGQVAAEIRSYRSPEPYKGKGVRYEDEYIFRKEGKKK